MARLSSKYDQDGEAGHPLKYTFLSFFRDQILEQQRAAKVRVITPPHAVGFLDPDLPPVHQPLRRRRLRRHALESKPAS